MSKSPSEQPRVSAETDVIDDPADDSVAQNGFFWKRLATRAPAVPVAVSFALGILLDSTVPVAWIVWLVAGFIFGAAWKVIISRGWNRISTACLLLACLCVGGARHHLAMSVIGDDDISLFAEDKSRPVHLVGQIVTAPQEFLVAKNDIFSAIPQSDRTSFRMRCTELESQGEMIPVSGLSQVSVSGRLTDVEVGDRIDLHGQLKNSARPLNPGQFDYRDYLRRQNTRCLCYVENSEAIVSIGKGSVWSPARICAHMRRRCDRLFRNHLSPANVPVAAALLLGDRREMNDQIREAFAQSGTIHVLAISGLHIGILATVLWFLCRVLNTSERMTAIVVIVCIVSYAVFTGSRPPVVRASILISILVTGRALQRQAFSENALAIAAIAILGWNPTDLLDSGTQLSFLAVMAILWSSRWKPRIWKRRYPVPSTFVGRWGHRARRFGNRIVQMYVISAAVWIVVAPLVMDRFHLVSPAGLLINVLIIPLVTVVLWFGYAFVSIGLLVPGLASVLGTGFDVMLSAMLTIVEAASSVELSHRYVPSLPDWWLAGYYFMLAGIVYLPQFRHRVRARCGVYCTWLLVGLSGGLISSGHPGLRCTFLAMGHGCSVLIELPNNRTILYDAGSLSGGKSAQQRIQGVLWNRGISRLDAIVASHADVDHFNAIPGILRTIPTGNLLISRQFLDLKKPSVRQLSEAAADEGVPIRIIGGGDRLEICDDVAVQVLHPGPRFHSDDDNANSVTLMIEYSGRRILLAGDLEDAGLDTLLAQESRKVDILLSPHHGSRDANPAELAHWAQQPGWVVISGRRPERVDALQEIYRRPTRVLSTEVSGAVTFRIERDGTIDSSSHLDASQLNGELSR